jgi:prophage DNA circulation protein
MAWYDYLQTASWKGVTFSVATSARTGGRRIAEHDYPFRDDVWPEDIGLAPRQFAMRGFLVGDDCYAQEDAMHFVCAQAGPGILVHPTLGAITVTLQAFSSSISAESGRVVEIEFQFVRGATSAIFPSAITDVLSAVLDAADAAQLAASGDYGDLLAGLSSSTEVSSFLTTETGISSEVVSQVGSWASLAGSVASDAGILTSAATGLRGNYGRYALGGRSTSQDPTATIDSALAGVATARTTVAEAISTASGLASLVDG